jgi:hypothetical protein
MMENDNVFNLYSGTTLLAIGITAFVWSKFNTSTKGGDRTTASTVFYWRPWSGSANQISRDPDGFFARNTSVYSFPTMY